MFYEAIFKTKIKFEKNYRKLTSVKTGKNVPVSTPVQTLLILLTISGVWSRCNE
jgi:hypothetical protein